MPVEFRSKFEPSPALADRISELTPDNPFYTSKYNEVRKRLGSTPCALWLEDRGVTIEGCSAFLSKGRLNSRMEITSLPDLKHPDAFWGGVFELCRDQGFSSLSVHSFGSTRSQIPGSEMRTELRKRCEYRLDLSQGDLLKRANRQHRRKVRSATAAGLTIRVGGDETIRRTHVVLANVSLDRRRGRGFSIESNIGLAETDAFIATGAGTIYQALVGDEVMSTLLIALSPTGVYAQSSGTSDAGRELGASHFLFHRTACRLREEGYNIFNLGGADETSTGLREFKLGTGAFHLDLESAEFYLGSGLKRLATRAAAFFRTGGSVS